MANHVQNVAIVGASGRVGGAFAKALVEGGKHTVTALTRAGNNSNLPTGVKPVEVDYNDEASLVSALKGQQFLVITLSVRAPPDTHGKIAAAAVKAGVPWIMPNSYGFDPTNQNMTKDIPHGEVSMKNCDQILKLGGHYILLSCGQWYQWSLALGKEWFGFDIKNRQVTFYDDGLQKINIGTWEQCGRALASLLLLPEKSTGSGPSLEDYKDKAVYISSFRLSQRDMLDSLNRVLGTTDKDWMIEHEPSDKRNKDGWREYGEGKLTGMAKAMYSRIFFPSGEGDVEPSRTANELLKLPKEDLDDATREAVEMVESGWNPFAG